MYYFVYLHRQCNDIDSDEDVGNTIRQLDEPVYENECIIEISRDLTASHDEEHEYEIVSIDMYRCTTNQSNVLQGNEHEYDRLDGGQKGHETIPLELCNQHKILTERNQESTELEKSVYSRLKQKNLEKRDSEEHIYHVLEGPSN